MLPQNPNLFAKVLQRVAVVLQHAVVSVRDSLLQDNDEQILLALVASYSLPLPQKLTLFLMVLQAEFGLQMHLSLDVHCPEFPLLLNFRDPLSK